MLAVPLRLVDVTMSEGVPEQFVGLDWFAWRHDPMAGEDRGSVLLLLLTACARHRRL